MKKYLIPSAAVIISTLAFYFSWAQEKFQTLDNVAIDGGSVVMTVSGPVQYHAFKITNPPRVVIEFTNTEFNAKERELSGSGNIKRIRSGQYQNFPTKVARIVVDMVKMTDYELKGDGNIVKLAFFPQNAPVKAEEKPAEVKEAAAKNERPVSGFPVAPVTAQTAQSPAVPAAPAVAVGQKASAQAPEAAKTADDTPIVIAQPIPESESKKIEFPKSAKAAKEAESPAGTPVNKTEPKPQQAAAATSAVQETVKAAVVPPVMPTAQQQPKPAQAAEASSKPVVLPKKPITIDFEDADIRDVFRMLSMKSGINIIYGNDVTGTITLRLENVPFDKAFETILSLKNLVSQEQGANILRIATPQQISEERAQAVTFTKVYPLNYAKADDVRVNLDSIRSAEGRKGSTSVDERTNSLIITDTPEGLVSLERIIRELDQKPAQVIIEAKIVEVTLNNSFDMGIQWQYANTTTNGNKTTTIGAYDPTTGNPLSAPAGGTGVAFPASAVSGQIGAISFGLVSDQTRLTAMLTALAQKGLSKILSNPKVTTINNKEAKILVGQRIPYTTTTVTTAGSTQSTQFLDVGVKLTVTPTINKDQKITLVVHPEVSLFVRSDAAGPVVGTREANTTVIVNSGETVVIGGLITEQDIKSGTQVPLLGDLPVIGFMFKRTFDSKERSELLVFLTPQIMGN